MEKKNNSSIIGVIGVVILIIILYNSMFSGRARMNKNLKELADTKEFLSTEVDKDVLDYVFEQKGYAMMEKRYAKDYQKLGTVKMIGKNDNTINTFDVYVRDGHDYAINMRGIYMKVLNMKGKN